MRGIPFSNIELNSSKSMKIQFHIRGLNANADLRRWLEQSLERMESLISVTAAAVVLEHRRDEAPTFRAYVSLAVPGPDIHADARDHTLEAAWLKVTAGLRKQIEQRTSRQQIRSEAGRQRRTGPKVRRGFPSIHNRIFSPIFSGAH
jgi:ribosome-associated translation inhibitor RaiA